MTRWIRLSTTTQVTNSSMASTGSHGSFEVSTQHRLTRLHSPESAANPDQGRWDFPISGGLTLASVQTRGLNRWLVCLPHSAGRVADTTMARAAKYAMRVRLTRVSPLSVWGLRLPWLEVVWSIQQRQGSAHAWR